ncbi:hypothetical protein [Bacteroides ihuae]|uniref:hypothetical protein n=1 Tax=Bacteroides ihuae TaxID=1852362 RepID=UPI0013562F3D|nr:hypothetical protein [Bacteroides ihuae]
MYKTKASEAKHSHERSKVEQKRKIGLFYEALNGEDAWSVKQAILFERSEFNRL